MASRISVRLSAFAALMLVLQPALATFKNDFSSYPSASQDCLYQASNSSNCVGDTMVNMNKCLCGNGGNFVSSSAACLGKDDPDDVDDVYTTMAAACSWSATPISITEDEFKSYANGSTTVSGDSSSSSSSSSPSSSTTSGDTNSASPTTYTTTSSGHVMTITTTGTVPTNTGDNSSSDSSNGSVNSTAKIGIIAGASVAGVAILAMAACILLWYRRRRRSGPGGAGGGGMTAMAVGGGGKYSQVSSGTELSPYSPYDEWKASASGGDPKWRASTATAATTPGLLSTEWTAASQHPQEQTFAYELSDQSISRPAAEVPVELPAPGPTATGASPHGSPYMTPYGTPQQGTPHVSGQQWPPTAYGR